LKVKCHYVICRPHPYLLYKPGIDYKIAGTNGKFDSTCAWQNVYLKNYLILYSTEWCSCCFFFFLCSFVINFWESSIFFIEKKTFPILVKVYSTVQKWIFQRFNGLSTIIWTIMRLTKLLFNELMYSMYIYQYLSNWTYIELL
jgi:hypothetical protein